MVRRGGLLRGCGRGRNSRFPLDALPGLPRRVAARGEAPGEASPRDRRGRVELAVHGSGRIPRRIAEGRASAPYFFSCRLLESSEFRRGSCPLRASIGADRRRSVIEDEGFSSHFPATASPPGRAPSGSESRTPERPPRFRPKSAALPPKRALQPRVHGARPKSAPFARALRSGRAAHNSEGGRDARTPLGARSAPTDEPLTLSSPLPLVWTSPLSPGGKGAGGKGRGKAAFRGLPVPHALRGVPARRAPCRAGAPACLRGSSKPRETGAGVRGAFPGLPRGGASASRGSECGGPLPREAPRALVVAVAVAVVVASGLWYCLSRVGIS